jgi:hypothetical protein
MNATKNCNYVQNSTILKNAVLVPVVAQLTYILVRKQVLLAEVPAQVAHVDVAVCVPPARRLLFQFVVVQDEVEPVVRLPQPQGRVLRAPSRLGRVQAQQAEEERLARRLVERRHVIGQDTQDVKLLKRLR